jgi:hypothetical protein
MRLEHAALGCMHPLVCRPASNQAVKQPNAKRWMLERHRPSQAPDTDIGRTRDAFCTACWQPDRAARDKQQLGQRLLRIMTELHQ